MIKTYLMGTTALVATLFLLTAAPAWSKPNVSDFARQCDSGNQKACRDLAKVALEDRDANFRKTATLALTDQSLLAKIAVEDRDAFVRLAAASKLSDQSLLSKIAVDDIDAIVRIAATERLTDQSLLARIAGNAR